MCDISAALLLEKCYKVETEPELQPFNGAPLYMRGANLTDGVRLDINAKGFWDRSRFEATFFDLWVFSDPYAASYRLSCFTIGKGADSTRSRYGNSKAHALCLTCFQAPAQQVEHQRRFKETGFPHCWTRGTLRTRTQWDGYGVGQALHFSRLCLHGTSVATISVAMLTQHSHPGPFPIILTHTVVYYTFMPRQPLPHLCATSPFPSIKSSYTSFRRCIFPFSLDMSFRRCMTTHGDGGKNRRCIFPFPQDNLVAEQLCRLASVCKGMGTRYSSQDRHFIV